jgi:ribosomal protein L24E
MAIVLQEGKVREYSDGPEQSAFRFPREPRALNWLTVFQSHRKSQKNRARNNAEHQIRALISANCSIMMHEARKGTLSA